MRYRNAGQFPSSGLDHDRGSDPGNPRPVYAMGLSAVGLQRAAGRAAIAIGNPDEAEDIADHGARERAAASRVG